MAKADDLSRNAMNRIAIAEVMRRLAKVHIRAEETLRSAVNPAPGHILVHGKRGDFYVFVRAARQKVQTDRTRKVVGGKTLNYVYQRTCWEANIASNGQHLDPAPGFWAIVLMAPAQAVVTTRDRMLMIPNDRIEGKTIRVAEKGPMSRWLVYDDWALLEAAIDRARVVGKTSVAVPDQFHRYPYHTPFGERPVPARKKIAARQRSSRARPRRAQKLTRRPRGGTH